MSAPTGLILPGKFSPPYLAPIDPRLATASAAMTANAVYLQRLPRVESPKLLSAGYYFWSSVAANGAMSLLTADRVVVTEADAAAATYTAVASSAPAAAAGANTWQSLAFTAPYWYNPGVDLWVAIGFDAAAVVLRISSASNTTLLFGQTIAKLSAYSSGIPASISGSMITSASHPNVIVA